MRGDGVSDGPAGTAVGAGMSMMPAPVGGTEGGEGGGSGTPLMMVPCCASSAAAGRATGKPTGCALSLSPHAVGIDSATVRSVGTSARNTRMRMSLRHMGHGLLERLTVTRQATQAEWPHGAVTASAAVSMQMGQSSSASSDSMCDSAARTASLASSSSSAGVATCSGRGGGSWHEGSGLPENQCTDANSTSVGSDGCAALSCVPSSMLATCSATNWRRR
mmetsp:Transcript_53009/g.123898  ORF Transcript_53009/g.123898 Transcript_53009/m.123898 type:complete len:220 (+) Transcript_53009:326-985(+)